MKKIFIAFAMIAISTIAFAQSEEPATNGFGAKLRESNFHLGLDLQTKYIWRGMEMMTNDAAPVYCDRCPINTRRCYNGNIV